jgi:UBX domain-containing protein 1
MLTSARNVPRPGGEDEPAGPSHFTGRGFTVGGEDAPSRVIEPPQSRQRERPPRVQRTLYLWQDGFSVDEGPLYVYTDPANERTLAMINSGSAPIHILDVQPNQEVDLTLQNRKDEKYVKPKPKYKPFGGEGRRLGSPGASIVQTAPAPAAPSAPAASASAGPAAPEVTLDSSQPVISVLFRLGDGTRLPARFNASHTVADLYEFVDQARATERAYVLMTTFPSNELANKSAQLADVPELKNGGTVMQKWT